MIQDMAANLELHREFLSTTGSPEAALGPLFAVYQAGGERHASDRESLALAARSCRKLGKLRGLSEEERTKLVGDCEDASAQLGSVSQDLAQMQLTEQELRIQMHAQGDQASGLERAAFARERLADDMAAETDALQNERDSLQSEVDALEATGLKAAATRSAIQLRDREADSNWARAQLEMEDHEKSRHLQNYRLRAVRRSLQNRREAYDEAVGLCQQELAQEDKLKQRLREERQLAEQLRERIGALHQMAAMPRKQVALSADQHAIVLE
eukprot:gnl/MRDRNA2_/MRDRNA2_57821_c0_seq2.p1 gnl/MRDRNA2_/MRDRNA2_57821_c0~~gnl/MRDRNA2_/MRDRNA2_57821_c0_seq2.p1  ORF type:complete len:270 (-),score=67.90 gnl/MRDRNA2_/MRDRNA2_57821_c0_seq2:235-1044(-)